MERSLNECFGIHEIVTIENIDSTLKVISSLYDENELRFINERTAELKISNGYENGNEQSHNDNEKEKISQCSSQSNGKQNA